MNRLGWRLKFSLTTCDKRLLLNKLIKVHINWKLLFFFSISAFLPKKRNNWKCMQRSFYKLNMIKVVLYTCLYTNFFVSLPFVLSPPYCHEFMRLPDIHNFQNRSKADGFFSEIPHQPPNLISFFPGKTFCKTSVTETKPVDNPNLDTKRFRQTLLTIPTSGIWD